MTGWLALCFWHCCASLILVEKELLTHPEWNCCWHRLNSLLCCICALGKRSSAFQPLCIHGLFCQTSRWGPGSYCLPEMRQMPDNSYRHCVFILCASALKWSRLWYFCKSRPGRGWCMVFPPCSTCFPFSQRPCGQPWILSLCMLVRRAFTCCVEIAPQVEIQ